MSDTYTLRFIGLDFSSNPVRYNFEHKGSNISLLAGDARALVSSVPLSERNCQVAFNTIRFVRPKRKDVVR